MFLHFQLISCNSKERDEIELNNTNVENVLEKYANIHNQGLDYIKLDMEKTSDVYTKSRLDSVFVDYLINQYGKKESNHILCEINPLKEFVLNGHIPSLKATRSGESDVFLDNANANAKEALNVCMSKMSNYLDEYDADNIFDNTLLLNDLHALIIETFTSYKKKCDSDNDLKALSQTLGVLYGSIEYWTCSDNVESWGAVNIEREENSSEVISNSNNASIRIRKKEPKKKEKENDRMLSKNEWIQTVAAADALGAIAGGAAGGATGAGAGALASSAAAALYFDVK